MSDSLDAIREWWKRYGHLMQGVPNGVLDELDARIRAHEREKCAAAMNVPKVVSHTAVERRDRFGVSGIHEVVTFDDGLIAYWSKREKRWKPALKTPNWFALSAEHDAMMRQAHAAESLNPEAKKDGSDD
jgi:hypothetical protein